MAAAGQKTWRTGPSCTRVTNASRDDRHKVWRIMIPHVTTMISASQNGKNPLFGPSVPQPIPRRMASKSTIPPSSINTDAVTKSAARILFAQQTALCHQLAVQFFVLLHPLDVLGASSGLRLERAFFQIFLEIGSVINLFEKAGIPLNGVLRHVGRSKDAAEHEIVNVCSQRFFNGRNFFPVSHWNPSRIENGKRP